MYLILLKNQDCIIIYELTPTKKKKKYIMMIYKIRWKK